MSTLKSSSANLTLNADGSGNDIKFQSNAVEVGSLTAEGVLTATSFAGSGSNLTGIDPSTIIKNSVNSFKNFYKTKILWASPRELLNLFQANNCGCHIITMDQSLLNKIFYINKNLEDYSLETVKMFYNDASEAGYKIDL